MGGGSPRPVVRLLEPKAILARAINTTLPKVRRWCQNMPEERRPGGPFLSSASYDALGAFGTGEIDTEGLGRPVGVFFQLPQLDLFAGRQHLDG